VLALLFSRAYADGHRFLPLQLAGFALFALLDVFANALMAAGRHRAVAMVLTATVPFVWTANYLLIPAFGPMGAAVSLILGIAAATVVAGAIAGRHFGALVRGTMLARVLLAAGVVGFASAAWPAQGPLVLGKLAVLGAGYVLILYLQREITLEDLGIARDTLKRSRVAADRQ
jgi:O-antigen/teichoic acid export membrane protein